MNRKNIVIVGGGGRLGSWFARYFNDCGWHIAIVEAKDTCSPAEIAANWETIMLAVPHPVASEVIESYAPYISDKNLLVDISSVKSKINLASQDLKSEVLLIHPMWSPQVKDMHGQTIVVCNEGRHARLSGMILEEFQNSGAILNYLSAEEHDRVMALVQVASHAMLLGLGELHRMSGFKAESLTASESPIYRMISAALGRILSHQAELYADIALCNPYGAATVTRLAECLTEFGEMLRAGRRDDFLLHFQKLQEYRADEVESAVADSATMIEALAQKRGNNKP